MTTADEGPTTKVKAEQSIKSMLRGNIRRNPFDRKDAVVPPRKAFEKNEAWAIEHSTCSQKAEGHPVRRVEPAGTGVLMQGLARNRNRQYEKFDHLFKITGFSFIFFSVFFDFFFLIRCLCFFCLVSRLDRINKKNVDVVSCLVCFLHNSMFNKTFC